MVELVHDYLPSDDVRNLILLEPASWIVKQSSIEIF